MNSDENDESIETLKSSTPVQSSQAMTLQKAIELGEYDPKFLAGFAEWHNLSRHAQFQMVRKAMDNRRQHLISQWAEINNVLDFSKKPHLQDALKNIEQKMKEVELDREKLWVEYSNL